MLEIIDVFTSCTPVIMALLYTDVVEIGGLI